MYKGTVKFFNRKKSWGFIVEDSGKEVFVYYKNIKMDGFKTLKKGQRVKFDVAPAEKGATAINVEVIDE